MPYESVPMDISLSVLIVSRRREALDTIGAVLRKHTGLRVERKLVVNVITILLVCY